MTKRLLRAGRGSKMIKTLRQPKGFYRNVAALMIPMVLQSLITQSVAVADMLMVGSLSEQYLATIAVAMIPLFLFMIITFGIQNGAGILVAQYWGRGDKDTINRILGIALMSSIVVLLTGALIIFFFAESILSLLTSEMSLIPIAVPYVRVVAFSHLFGAVSMVYISFHRSMENPKLGFIILSISAILNLLSNWVLIFGRLGFPALGIQGAAFSTLGVRALEVIIISIYASRNKRLPLKLKLIFRPGISIFKDYLKLSLPVLLNEALWGVGFIAYPIILGHMSNAGAFLAAHNIAGNVERMFAVAVFACAGATAVIIGRELGAGRKDNIESIAKSLITLALLLGLASATLLMIARFTLLERFVYPLFDLSREASSASTIMITMLAFIIPLRTVGITTGLGILRGGGDVKALMFIDLGSLYLVSLPIAITSGLVLGLGVGFVYAGFLFEDLVKTSLLLWRFKSRKWVRNLTRPREQFE